jgi:Raf kinase inhibitor-like YbhB/YbcL family protein
MKFTLSSASFQNEGTIPRKHTCEGGDVAPELSWTGAPEATKSFAVIIDDPDAPDPRAPQGTWVHWVVYDIPATTTSLPEGTSAKSLPPGTHEGLNDFKRIGYGGPCPPIGRHRYFHKIYALDVALGDLGHPSKAVLENVMKGHVIAHAELFGTYQKGQ